MGELTSTKRRDWLYSRWSKEIYDKMREAEKKISLALINDKHNKYYFMWIDSDTNTEVWIGHGKFNSKPRCLHRHFPREDDAEVYVNNTLKEKTSLKNGYNVMDVDFTSDDVLPIPIFKKNDGSRNVKKGNPTSTTAEVMTKKKPKPGTNRTLNGQVSTAVIFE
jgi:predicted DNA-binding WGR domain protein